jgi:hypothetical protein
MTTSQRRIGRALFALTAALAFRGPGVAAASDDPIPMERFARGRELRIVEEAGLQTVLLDADVYAGSVEPGLADLRIYNADGEPVPHATRTLEPPEETERDRVPLPLFRLFPSEKTADGVATGEGFHIDADVSGEGARIRIQAPAPSDAATTADASGILLDTDDVMEPVRGLDFTLAEDEDDLVVHLRVEASDDLSHWERLVDRGALARIQQNGFRIERTQIRIPPTRRRFLRLTWPEATRSPRIESVSARLAPIRPGPPLQELRVTGEAVQDDVRSAVYDLGGWMPVHELQLLLTQPNSLFEADLFLGDGENGPWRRHFHGLVYSLEPEPTLRNPPIEVGGRRVRWVKLSVASKGGGLSAGIPPLRVSWRPEQLIFVPRGSPPYTLVYGLVDAPRSAFSAAELMRVARIHEQTLPLESASLGRVRTIAGDAAFEPRPEPVPARTVALWAVLIAAVALVVGLSVRLLRQMG